MYRITRHMASFGGYCIPKVWKADRFQSAQDQLSKWMQKMKLPIGALYGICTYIYHKTESMGNSGYPWEGTLAVVPQILLHIALYNNYIIPHYVKLPEGIISTGINRFLMWK